MKDYTPLRLILQEEEAYAYRDKMMKKQREESKHWEEFYTFIGFYENLVRLEEYERRHN